MKRPCDLILWCSLLCAIPGSGSVGEGPNSEFRQFIFFAVVEGLYEDGVSSETVDLIIPYNDFYEHFIYGCSMCMPTYDALTLYRGRDSSSVGSHGRMIR